MYAVYNTEKLDMLQQAQRSRAPLEHKKCGVHTMADFRVFGYLKCNFGAASGCPKHMEEMLPVARENC